MHINACLMLCLWLSVCGCAFITCYGQKQQQKLAGLVLSHVITEITIITAEMADRFNSRNGRQVQQQKWQTGSTAEMAASRKEEKYTEIEVRHIFQPIAMETLGIFSSSARQFLSSLGHRISSSSGEARETCFLFQRILVLLQCFNAVLLHDCLPALDCADWASYLFVSYTVR